MKAIVLSQTGGVENLVVEEISVPTLTPDEVLVKVKAISINPVDCKTRKGTGVYGTIKNESPLVIGWDISGEVTQVGANVTRFRVGDEVFGMVNFPGHGKAYAEYVAAPASHLASKPTTISHEEAAAATLAALTAWQVLVTNAGLTAGQKVLIHAAAGGVGHYAVQIAKHFGAYVIGTSSAANREFVLALGADEHLDYTQERFEEKVKDADLVLETVGGENLLRSIQAAKKGGKVISILGASPEAKQKAEEVGVTAYAILVASNGEDMQALANLLAAGIIKSHVSHAFPFEKMAEAHQQVETGRTKGKVIVTT